MGNLFKKLVELGVIQTREYGSLKNTLKTIDKAYQPPTGKWLLYSAKHGLYTCSECHFFPRYRTNYCPNCGAKMETHTF